MSTSFAVSRDGTRIAYDVTGTGPGVVLLHGGAQNRRVWEENGTLTLDSLSAQDRAMWEAGSIPVRVDLLGAILGWPPVEPADLRCPTLWVVGTANETAMAGVNDYRDGLGGTKVVLQLLPGLTHADELTKVDDVLPCMREFTRS